LVIPVSERVVEYKSLLCYTHIYAKIHTYRHAKIHKDRHAKIHTYRQAKIHTYRPANRETNTKKQTAFYPFKFDPIPIELCS